MEIIQNKEELAYQLFSIEINLYILEDVANSILNWKYENVLILFMSTLWVLKHGRKWFHKEIMLNQEDSIELV